MYSSSTNLMPNNNDNDNNNNNHNGYDQVFCFDQHHDFYDNTDCWTSQHQQSIALDSAIVTVIGDHHQRVLQQQQHQERPASFPRIEALENNGLFSIPTAPTRTTDSVSFNDDDDDDEVQPNNNNGRDDDDLIGGLFPAFLDDRNTAILTNGIYTFTGNPNNPADEERGRSGGGGGCSEPSTTSCSPDSASGRGDSKDDASPKSSSPSSFKLQKTCRVCGDKALGYNFNVVTCESCKAFFRRNATRKKELRCPFEEDCAITVKSRRYCPKCRLRKCFEVGMKPEYILNEKQLTERRRRQAVQDKLRFLEEAAGAVGNFGTVATVPENGGSNSNSTGASPDCEITTSNTSPVRNGGNNICWNRGGGDPMAIFSSPPPPPPQMTNGSPFLVDVPSPKTALLQVVFNNNGHAADQVLPQSQPPPIAAAEPMHLYSNGSTTSESNNFAIAYNNNNQQDEKNHHWNELQAAQLSSSGHQVNQLEMAQMDQRGRANTTTYAFESSAGYRYNNSTGYHQNLDEIRDTTTATLDILMSPPKSFDGGNNNVNFQNGGDGWSWRCAPPSPVAPSAYLDLRYAKLGEILMANEEWTKAEALGRGIPRPPPDRRPHKPRNLEQISDKSFYLFTFIIKQHKRLSSFKCLPSMDQWALMTACAHDMIVLRMAFKFRQRTGDEREERRCFKNSSDDRVCVSSTAAGNTCRRDWKELIDSLPQKWRANETIMLLVSALLLFNPNRVELQNKAAVTEQQHMYRQLFLDYLKSTYDEQEAQRAYQHLLWIVDILPSWVQKHAFEIAYQLNPETLEPTLVRVLRARH